MVVAYTESAEENGFYRLKKLGIDNYFKEVYVSDSLYKRPDTIPSSPKTHIVHGKKPNAEVLKEICCGEKVSVCEAVYIGDSLSKDMMMAKQAGITSIWCDFPRDDIRDLYSKLVAISHWKESNNIKMSGKKMDIFQIILFILLESAGKFFLRLISDDYIEKVYI